MHLRVPCDGFQAAAPDPRYDRVVYHIHHLPPALKRPLIGAIGTTLIQLAPIKLLEHTLANAGNVIVGSFAQNIEDEITDAIGINPQQPSTSRAVMISLDSPTLQRTQ